MSFTLLSKRKTTVADEQSDEQSNKDDDKENKRSKLKPECEFKTTVEAIERYQNNQYDARKQLELMHELKFEWHPDTTKIAAKYGQEECIEFAVEHGCPLHEETTFEAAKHSHIECLEYAYNHGCGIDFPSKDIMKAVETSQFVSIKCLAFLHQHGCKFTSVAQAALLGDTASCKELIEQGLPYTHQAKLNAAKEGHLECLQYLHSINKKWQSGDMFQMALEGRFECLKFAAENGCCRDDEIYDDDEGLFTDNNATLAASKGGSLECLKYLHKELKFYLHPNCISFASAYGNEECFIYLIKNGFRLRAKLRGLIP